MGGEKIKLGRLECLAKQFLFFKNAYICSMSKVVKVEGEEDYYIFTCPACRYCHGIYTPRWTFNGDLEKPTVSPSIVVNAQYLCHSFVRDGKIIFLGDCTHSFANQTLDIPDF